MFEACCLWFVILKKYVELTQAEDRVTWPDLLHRHKRAREFPGMIGCFRVAPNSGPTRKSLPAPYFSFGLNLLKGRHGSSIARLTAGLARRNTKKQQSKQYITRSSNPGDIYFNAPCENAAQVAYNSTLISVHVQFSKYGQ